MEISAISGKQTIRTNADISTGSGQGDGAGFLTAVAAAVKDGKIVMPGGGQMTGLDFLKNKFAAEGINGAEETEEEKIYGFLARIKRILEESKR
ncbi:MAG: hypothetical protein WC624_04960 [Candidatus Margulisiibacteriota bacterium]